MLIKNLKILDFTIAINLYLQENFYFLISVQIYSKIGNY